MINMKLENKDFENSVLGGDMDIAVPLEITENLCGTDVLTYAICKDIAEELAMRCKDGSLNDDTIAWANERIANVMNQFDFSLSKNPRRWINRYTATQPYSALKLDDIHIFSESEKPSFDLSEFGIADDTFPFAAKLLDGRAVSVAYVNDLTFQSGSLEIGVDTLPMYRQRGWGSSCVSALCNYLLKNGADRVIYHTYADNIASNKTAVRAGLAKSARIYSFVFYRQEQI